MTFYHSQNCSEYYLCLPDGQCNEAEDVVTTTGEQVSILHVVARCRIDWNLNNLVRVKSIVQLCVVEPVLKSDKNMFYLIYESLLTFLIWYVLIVSSVNFFVILQVH